MGNSNKSSQQHDPNNAVIARATVVMAFIAALTFVISCVQWYEINKQSQFIEQQLKLTREDLLRTHRPWVGISGPIKIEDPLAFDNKTVSVSFSYQLKNTGNSAATQVSTSWALLVGENVEESSCSPDKTKSQRGAALLPTDDFFDKQSIKVGHNLPAEIKKTFINLHVCVQYLDEFGKSHVTGSSWTYITNQGESKFDPLGLVEGKFKPIGYSNAF